MIDLEIFLGGRSRKGESKVLLILFRFTVFVPILGLVIGFSSQAGVEGYINADPIFPRFLEAPQPVETPIPFHYFNSTMPWELGDDLHTEENRFFMEHIAFLLGFARPGS